MTRGRLRSFHKNDDNEKSKQNTEKWLFFAALSNKYQQCVQHEGILVIRTIEKVLCIIFSLFFQR